MEHYAASLSGVFRMVLILLLIYFGVRLLGRLFGPSRSRGRSYGRGTGPGRRRERADHRQEGEVRIEYTDKETRSKKGGDSRGGEYVDYEELD